MKKQRTKTRGANLPVPQSRDEAAEAVRIVGELSRQIARIEADLNDRIAGLKETAEQQAAPLREQVTAKTEGLKVWAEANRTALTENGKVKFADLGTGKISWRMRPPSVRLRQIDAVIETVQKLGFTHFLRTKVEVSKDAMLADPDKARLVPGVTLGSGGEDFVVEPFEIELSSS
ncbi:host-nuclease inhibitor Gam family protein [Afifella pfennigii]|uniref:host-nuclease inhibitor Gam family protein n=1 Tax=Afifella pfennigii TaxID=209897 RepID=UPI000478BCB5|nr:host-nuclease inhibitor Gam family protein [Afifella pfennigii]